MSAQWEHTVDSDVLAERRAYPRYAPPDDTDVFVVLPSENTVQARVKDASHLGTCLVFHEAPKLEVGSQMYVWYNALLVQGEVRYVKEFEGKYRAGVRLWDSTSE